MSNDLDKLAERLAHRQNNDKNKSDEDVYKELNMRAQLEQSNTLDTNYKHFKEV